MKYKIKKYSIFDAFSAFDSSADRQMSAVIEGAERDGERERESVKRRCMHFVVQFGH